MTQQAETIRFHNPAAFTGLTGTIDTQNCIIHGVSLIQPFVEAEGHGLWVDDVTATQLFEAAKVKGKVPVNMDHGSGITSMNGYITNVRMDNGRPRGDWHLLKSHEDTVTMLERASEMSECFGLSAAFRGDPKGVLFKGKQCARVEKLLSFDVVVRPAANEGLFSAKDNANVDSRKNSVRSKTIELQNTMPAEPTLQDVLAQLQSVQQTIAQQGEIQQTIVSHINEGIAGDQNQGEEQGIDRDQLEAYNNASDEQLAELGITRADVDAAVSDFNASLGGEQGEQGQEADGQYEGSYGGEQGAGEMASAGGGAETGAAGQAFAALQRELIELKRKFNAKEQKEIQFAEAQATNDVRTKISTIVAQRDQSIQLAEKLVSENEALRMHVRTGTRPVIAGIDTGIRLFSRNESGELHPWQERVRQIELSEKVSTAKAMTMADKEDNGAAHSDFIASQSPRNARR
jgi:hypothetical protein